MAMSEKENIPSKLWDIVTTLSESTQQAAVRKAQDLGFDLDAGQIPFQETLINLSHDRDVLREAVEKGRIVQIPLKLQYRLLAEATKVKAQLEQLVSGSDVVLPLENAVDDLSATIWQLNLQNLSPEVLSFESKMNDLKTQEIQIKKVLSEARKLEGTIRQLSELHAEAESKVKATSEYAEEGRALTERITAFLKNSEEAERTALGSASVVQQHQTDIANTAALARDANAEILSIKENSREVLENLSESNETFGKIRDEIMELKTSTTEYIDSAKEAHQQFVEALREEVDTKVDSLVESTREKMDESISATSNQLKESIDQATENYTNLESEVAESEAKRESRSKAQLDKCVAEFEESRKTSFQNLNAEFAILQEKIQHNIDRHDTEAERLTKHLSELESRIHDSIERATGFTLFHSFQKRQADLTRSKYLWAYALLSCVVASIGLSAFFIFSLGGLHELNTLFLMKLSISLPIIFAITFCSVQYSKERRLEEEYAFKSNISISLEPYRKLVGSLVNLEDSEERAKYTAFIISSINRVFTSPTGLVFDSDEKGGETAKGLLKTAGDVAETLLKIKVR
jgi:hypothetical protein